VVRLPLSRFGKTDLKCVVISTSSTFRGLLSSILKELSFSNITTVGDIQTCIEIMETEPVGWVIAPTRDNDAGHVLHILNIIDKNPALRALKVTILRDEDDSCIPHAFELGAFSVHKFETSKEACQQEFHKLMQRVERYDGDCTRVSADYLRDYLTEKGEFQELKRFYVSLLEVYPQRGDILLDLASTHYLAQEPENAKIILQQLVLTAPERKGQIEALCKLHAPDEVFETMPTTHIAGHYGFRTCLILDSDKSYLAQIEALSSRLGFESVHCFEDPISLMRWLRRNPPPDLVISEWQLPEIPGPVFLYKVRHRLDLHVPIIITNRQLTQKDSTWIKELEISCLVGKPIIDKEMFQAILWTMQQTKGPTDLQSLRTKLKIASKAQSPELFQRRQSYMQHPMLIEADRLLMEAQLAFDAGCYLHAKKYSLDALKEAGDPREVLEILGKTLMKLREFDAALRCLENVNVLSPYNVTYLCEIAECHLENGDDSKFDAYLDKAKGIDADAQVVIETAAKGAIKKGHTDTAKRLLQSLKSFKEVLAFMNNRAVALIQVGRHEQGLELYKKALNSIPDGQAEVRSLINYNLGLGFARANRFSEAIAVLPLAGQTKNAARLRKVKSLRMRIDKAVMTGDPLIFSADAASTLEDEAEKLRTMNEIAQGTLATNKIYRSDYCLHKIFRTLLDSTMAEAILETAPSFLPRGKMVKDYINGISLSPPNTP